MIVHENKQILTTSPYHTWYWSYAGAVWPEDLMKVREICDAAQEQEAVTEGKTSENPDYLIRNNKVAWLDDERIYDFIRPFANGANHQSGWNFDLSAIEVAQYTIYYGEGKNHYSWHTDTIINDRMLKEKEGPCAGTIRKMTCIVQMSSPDEYEGGDFQLLSGKSREYLEEGKEVFDVEPITLPHELKEKGSILVFPSFSYHRVTPVTKGIRRSLVFWFRGPPWV